MWKILIGSLFIVLTVTASLIKWTSLYEKNVNTSSGGPAGEYYFVEEHRNHKNEKSVIHFDLVDPECAPDAILAKIVYGYQLMLHTHHLAPQYVGNELNCNHCHFNGGNTLGGKNRGISLCGVTEAYPRFSKRDGKAITLKERISNCFKRSMNGTAPPDNSLEMDAIVAYLEWISHGFLETSKLPWLGLGELPYEKTPNPENGKVLYPEKCASCHGMDGNGTPAAPPLWGDRSFNNGAGMHTLPMLSTFIWLNMPYGQPELTPEEAIDIAEYVRMQPRPHYTHPQ